MSATEHHHDAHHGISHVAAARVLLATGSTLLFLTFATVMATHIDFGANINLAIAMLIAVTKASLVILFFTTSCSTRSCSSARSWAPRCSSASR